MRNRIENKYIMLKEYITIFFVAIQLILAGCEKENAVELESKTIDKIIASIEGGNELGEYYQIATVDAIATIYLNGQIETNVIATANFINGGFTMELPETVSDEFLSKQIAYNHIKVRDPNANTKMTYVVYFFAYNTDGEYVGFFEYINDSEVWITTAFWYADDDVVLTYGAGLVSCSLKKGWNLVYEPPAVSKEDIDCVVWRFNDSRLWW